jgi:hypothetical protein
MVPSKGPETKKRYDREYKRRLRAQQGLTKPGQTRGWKGYICLKVPHLRLSGLAFRDGWFIAADPQEQAAIEQDQADGQFIFSWRVEP